MIASLEDALVREFRACQSLQQVITEERRSLVQHETAALMPLVEQKEVILDELIRLEETRQACRQALDEFFEHQDAKPSFPARRSLPDPAVRTRLGRLRKGIQALFAELRELNQGNQALAHSALENVQAILGLLPSQPIVHPQDGEHSSLIRQEAAYRAVLEVSRRTQEVAQLYELPN
jgi:flagellar biosynthesis/type III secretory pathway chaperone